MLESLYKEIEILSKCRHRNIVKLLGASFNGTIIKEAVPIRKTSVDHTAICHVDTSLHFEKKDGEEVDENIIFVKRKTNVCYCVLKLAAHGELFKLLESTE